MGRSSDGAKLSLLKGFKDKKVFSSTKRSLCLIQLLGLVEVFEISRWSLLICIDISELEKVNKRFMAGCCFNTVINLWNSNTAAPS